MALVEISEVTFHRGNFLGASIDTPRAGTESETYSFDLRGWALGRIPVVALELDHSGSPWRIPLDFKRPQVASLYSDIPHAMDSGFHTKINSVLLATDFVLRIIALLDDGTRVPLGVIRGRRAPLRSSFKPRLQPLMITTLGRSGSTVLVRMLEAHARILAFAPRQYDPRVATYWMDVLRALSSPTSYIRQLVPPPRVSESWWLGTGSPYPLEEIPDHIQSWMGVESVKALAAFCQSRIDAFYEQLATFQEEPDATYFVEKFWAPSTPALLWEIYPDAREIVLVRDFRDFVCSTFAYNRKSGGRAFVEAGLEEELEYIVGTVKPRAFALMNHWKRRADRAHLLRYEDLILRPEETLQSLLVYLGLEPAAADLEAMLERLFERTPEMVQHLTSSSQSASVGRWRQDLSVELQQACEEALAPALKTFGYSDERSISSHKPPAKWALDSGR